MNKKETYKKRMSLLKSDLNKFSNEQFVRDRLLPNGKVQIDIVLPPDLELFHPLAPNSYKVLNPEIYNYIDEQVYFVPSEYDICLHFVGRELTAEQQKQIDLAVHKHYNLQVYDKLDDIRRNRLLGIFLLIFGVIALALYFFLQIRNKNLLMLEVVSIVGTFSVWEAVDCWLIQGHERRTALHNALQMAVAEITFENVNKETQNDQR